MPKLNQTMRDLLRRTRARHELHGVTADIERLNRAVPMIHVDGQWQPWDGQPLPPGAITSFAAHAWRAETEKRQTTEQAHHEMLLRLVSAADRAYPGARWFWAI